MPPGPWRKSKFPPGIYVESAWQVFGGTSVAAVHAKLEKQNPKDADVYADPTICAAAQYGKGLVMVASFGNMFNDKNLGNDWSHDPDPAERARYDLLFALLRRLVQDEPIVVPTRNAGVGGAEDQCSAQSSRPPCRRRTAHGSERLTATDAGVIGCRGYRTSRHGGRYSPLISRFLAFPFAIGQNLT